MAQHIGGLNAASCSGWAAGTSYSPCCRRAGATQQRPAPARSRRVASTTTCSINTSTTDAVTATAPGLLPEPWTGSAEQLQALGTLRSRMATSRLGCPDDATLKWYLRDRYFDVQEAEQKLVSMLTWRRDFAGAPGAIAAEQVQRELATGKAYVAEHADRWGRPAIVVRVQRHVTGQFLAADSRRMCAHLLDSAVSQLPPTGPTEQLVGLFDLRGFTLANADFDFARFLVDAFFEYYPRRVGEVLLVDAPWLFRAPWEVIKPLLRKYAALVRFASLEEARALFPPGKAPPDFQ